jgi:hypothetical protein
LAILGQKNLTSLEIHSRSKKQKILPPFCHTMTKGKQSINKNIRVLEIHKMSSQIKIVLKKTISKIKEKKKISPHHQAWGDDTAGTH